jgi:hypothetical protein
MPLELPFETVKYLRTRVKEKGTGYVFTKPKYVDQFLPQLRRMFNIFDNDQSGEIDLQELRAALIDYKKIERSEIDKLLQLFQELDGVQDDGLISFDEFVSVMKTSSSFADPRSFYFLQDEHGADDEATERFSEFSNLYEREQNNRKIEQGRSYSDYKHFHTLFNGTYNLPKSYPVSPTNAHGLSSSNSLPSMFHVDADENRERRPQKQRKRRNRKSRTFLNANPGEAEDMVSPLRPALNKSRSFAGMRSSHGAKLDVSIKAKARQQAGKLIGSTLQLPKISEKYISPIKKKTQTLETLHTRGKSRATSIWDSPTITRGSSVFSPLQSRQRSSQPFSRASVRSMNVEIGEMGRGIFGKTSLGFNKRTQAVVGLRMSLPPPKFPLVSTW